MHFSLFLFMVAIAWVVREFSPLTPFSTLSWRQRWQRMLGLFLFPPLLLGTTAIAMLCMGMHGQMLGLPVGWMGCHLAEAMLGGAVGLLLWQAALGVRSLYLARAYPRAELVQPQATLLDTPILFAAQVGFWNPCLVVSRGLLDLPADQLNAVLTHEQAHRHYRDTFWFFWLGWVRQMMGWLPQTEALWQELLLLRELRADRWAAERVDPLLLAESLLRVVQSTPESTQAELILLGGVAFSPTTSPNRLEERIDALLDPEIDPSKSDYSPFTAIIPWTLGLTFMPLCTMLFHR